MKPTSLLFTILLWILPSIVSAQIVEALARARVDANETPGIVIGVYENGKTQYFFKGYADVAAQSPVNSKTLFEIGSITKTFTNILLEQQAVEGKVSLTDPAQRFLPTGVKVPSRNGKAITLLDLATAHSGLPRLPDNMQPADQENPYIDYTEEKLEPRHGLAWRNRFKRGRQNLPRNGQFKNSYTAQFAKNDKGEIGKLTLFQSRHILTGTKIN